MTFCRLLRHRRAGFYWRSGMSIEITHFSPGDRAAWEPLWRGYQTFYETSLPADATDTAWARMLDPAEPVFGAIAKIGEEAIGFTHWIFHRSTWTPADYCFLQDLFVSESERGSGAGRALIEFVYAAAFDNGCSRVYWLTHETNETAMTLYDKVADRSGFVQYRKLSPFGRNDG